MVLECCATWTLAAAAVHKRQVMERIGWTATSLTVEMAQCSTLRSRQEMLSEFASGSIKLEARTADLDERAAICKPFARISASPLRTHTR